MTQIFSRLRSLRTLLIDDDEYIRNSMSMYFDEEGCTLVAFETAEEGLEELERNGYDVLLVDYLLPGMDGLEFLKRAGTSHDGVVKVLITGYGTEEVQAGAKRLGVRDIILKPFSIDTIERSLSRLLDSDAARDRKTSRNRGRDRLDQSTRSPDATH